MAKAATNTEKTATPAAVVSGVISNIDLPETARRGGRGGNSIYPFDSLEVGQFFGVQGKDKRYMSSVVSNQHKKHKVPVKDENGNTVYQTKKLTDASGNTTEVPDTSKPKTDLTKRFETISVTPEIAEAIKGTPAEGSTVLVRRIK